MEGHDTRFFGGEPPRETRFYVDGLPESHQLPSPRYSRLRRLAAGILRRIPPALAVAFFGLFQWGEYRHASLFRGQDDKLWSSGPFFYLFNASTRDDWYGYSFLTMAAVFFVAAVVWPRRETALLACAVALAWVVPGCVESLKRG
jgi:hypothetical protein